MDAVVEGDALRPPSARRGGRLMLLELEVRDAVAEQAAGLGVLLVDTCTSWPARASCCAQARPAGPEPTTATVLPVCASAGSGLIQPSAQARSAMALSIVLMVTGVSVEVQRAGGFARRRADAARELGEVVGRMQVARRLLPVAPVDEIVPVRDLVVHRTAVVTERDAAIHAAGTPARAWPPRTAAARIPCSGGCGRRPAHSAGRAGRSPETGDLAHPATPPRAASSGSSSLLKSARRGRGGIRPASPSGTSAGRSCPVARIALARAEPVSRAWLRDQLMQALGVEARHVAP